MTAVEDRLAEIDARADAATGEVWERYAAMSQGARSTTAALRAVLALHQSVTVYGLADDCGCSEGDPDWDDHHYSTDTMGDLLCDKSPTSERWCGECSQDKDGDGTTYPCPTVRAVETALDATP